jgi:DNA-binding phage protein
MFVKYLYNMTEAQIIQAIRRIAKRREKADQTRREATSELREWCRKAQAAGIPITQVASEAGLSRQGVYDLLGQKPGR